VSVEAKTELSRFNRVLTRYQEATKKSARDVINRAALNVAFESMKGTRRAKAEEIKRLGTTSDPNRKVWWMYVTKILKSTGYTIKRNTFASVRIGSRKRKRVKTGTVEVGIQGSFTREDLVRASNDIKSKRVRGIGYIAAGFLPAVRYFWNKVKDKPFLRSGPSVPKQYGSPLGRGYEEGSVFNPSAVIMNTTEAAVKVGRQAVLNAMRTVGIDMAGYLQKRMKRDAERARLGS
jgi:hypothetical protein